MSCIPFFFVIGAVVSCGEPANTGAPQPTQVRIAAARGAASPATAILSRYRVQNGLNAVVQDSALQKVAQAQANAMAKADVMSHDVAGSLTSRMAAFGAPCHACAENVGAGYRTLAEAFEGWRNSSGHNANMLNPAMRRIGLASARAANSRYGTYWALVLAQ